MKKSIWAHSLVKNEERYLWFSVMSVINFVDKILIWDTGSNDKTTLIIKELIKTYPEKIDFKEVGEVDIEEFTRIRQKMLEETKSDWLLILDGDEVWWEQSIKTVTDLIQEKGDSLESIVSPYYNIVGDIYHYQPEEAGQYRIDDNKGHFNIRALSRKIPGLHLEKPHGQQGFYDKDGILIQERDKDKRKFLDYPYMHFTNMPRSISRSLDSSVPKRGKKLKHEIGLKFPEEFKYPEVFYMDRPNIVFSPWEKMSFYYQLKATLETPFKKIKRKFVTSKPGY